MTTSSVPLLLALAKVADSGEPFMTAARAVLAECIAAEDKCNGLINEISTKLLMKDASETGHGSPMVCRSLHRPNVSSPLAGRSSVANEYRAPKDCLQKSFTLSPPPLSPKPMFVSPSFRRNAANRRRLSLSNPLSQKEISSTIESHRPGKIIDCSESNLTSIAVGDVTITQKSQPVPNGTKELSSEAYGSLKIPNSLPNGMRLKSFVNEAKESAPDPEMAVDTYEQVDMYCTALAALLQSTFSQAGQLDVRAKTVYKYTDTIKQLVTATAHVLGSDMTGEEQEGKRIMKAHVNFILAAMTFSRDLKIYLETANQKTLLESTQRLTDTTIDLQQSLAAVPR